MSGLRQLWWACELLVAEHRSEQPLHSFALDPLQPEFAIAFEHSVLGTPVVDTYRVRVDHGEHRIWLVQERFQGQGYGLPYTAGPQETLQKLGEDWLLTLNRVVDPLVIRPLPVAAMRLKVGENTWLLADLAGNTSTALVLTARGCGMKENDSARHENR